MEEEEREQALKEMPIEQLFEELDDTIQMDMMHMSNEAWTLSKGEKKVYRSIMKELKSRVHDAGMSVKAANDSLEQSRRRKH